jgi:selenocysteine lyase/cysteine desulfurase
MSLIHGLKASVELINRFGVRNIASYLEELTDYLCERLRDGRYQVVSSREHGEKSQIVCIQHRAGMSPMALYAHLVSRNIVTAPRGDRLRISPHLYNTSLEIDAFIDALP